MKALFLESLPYESAFRVGSHHYAYRFAELGWDVMWLSHPLSPLHMLHPVKRDFDVRMRAWREGPVRTREVLYYSPFTLLPTLRQPFLSSRTVARRSIRWTVPRASVVVEKAGFAKPDLIWLTNPVMQPLAASLSARCRAVRVPDATVSFGQIPESVQELEDVAIRDANAVFVVAAKESERISQTGVNAIRLPNGADYEHFSQPADEPPDLAAIPHPRIIYVGAVEYWFDESLLAEVVHALPEVHVVIVGPVNRGLKIADDARVNVLGPRSYDLIPAYLQHSDVAVIPFRRDKMVDAIHPIKVYEYLAAGLPVVSTLWPELEAMDPPMLFAEKGQFGKAVAAALSGGGPTIDVRKAYARANSWDERFRVVLEALGPCLSREARQ